MNYLQTHLYLAKCYGALGRKCKSNNAYKKYLDIYIKIKENKINNNFIELYTLNDCYKYEAFFKVAHYNYDKKEYDKAEKYLKDVVQVYEKLIENYPMVYLSEVIRTLENLKNLYNASNRPEEAEKILEKINKFKRRQT